MSDQNKEAAQAIVPPVVQALINQPLQIRLSEDEADTLRDVIGDSRNNAQEVTLTIRDGHTGFGLYAYSTEYPEEGSSFIKSVAAPIVATVPSEPIAWMVVDRGFHEARYEEEQIIYRANVSRDKCQQFINEYLQQAIEDGEEELPDLIAIPVAAPSTAAEQASDVRSPRNGRLPVHLEDVRNAALEEAALKCTNTMMINVDSYCGATASFCAEMIRALKSATPVAKGNAPVETKL